MNTHQIPLGHRNDVPLEDTVEVIGVDNTDQAR